MGRSFPTRRGPALLKWDGRRIVISPQIVYRGRDVCTSPARIPAYGGLCGCRIAAATKSGPLNCSGTSLRSSLSLPISQSPSSCCQLVAFVFASWLADCLPAPINLSLWSPVAADGARVLRLLDCFCRQAMALSGTSARDLSLLPTELQATLLIFRPSSGRRLRELLRRLVAGKGSTLCDPASSARSSVRWPSPLMPR